MNFWKLWAVVVLAVGGGLAPVQAAVVQAMESNGVAYFLTSKPARMERYQLSTRTWLASVNLPTNRGNPTAATVDGDGLYVAYRTMVYRYALNGTGEVFLMEAPNPVQSIHTDGNLLIVNYSTEYNGLLEIWNKGNNTRIDAYEGYTPIFGASIAPGLGRIFGRTDPDTNAGMVSVRYGVGGLFSGDSGRDYTGRYQVPTKSWLFPDQARVVDETGAVYGTGDLASAGKFGGDIDDLIFSGANVPIAVRGNVLVGYNAGLQETGSKVLAKAPCKVALDGADVVVFWPDASVARGVSATAVPLADLNAATPGLAVDPVTLAYTPDASFIGSDGWLYLLSRAHQSIFTWNPATQKYGATIPLSGVPTDMAYSAASNRIYVAYPKGVIRQIDLRAATIQEAAFCTLPKVATGLVCAGTYLFASVADLSGSDFQYTINASGGVVDSEDWQYFSEEYVWSEVRQKVYYLDGFRSLESVEVNASGSAYPGVVAGGMGVRRSSPYPTEVELAYPIRVSPEGASVVLGSGVVFDASTLAPRAQALGNTVSDIAWLSTSDLRTVRDADDYTEYQQWTGPTYTPGLTKHYPGQVHRLYGLNATQLLGISILANGQPSFSVIDPAFNIIAPPTLAKPAGLKVGLVSAGGVPLTWADIAGETSYQIERRALPSGAWTPVGTTAKDVTYFTSATPAAGSYGYRVTAKNGSLASTASDELVVSTGVPAQPQGLTAQTISSGAVALAWADVANNTGYQIERAGSASGPWTQLATAGENDTSYVLERLQAGVGHFFRIRATNLMGNSPYSNTASATTSSSVPSTPVLSPPVAYYGVTSLEWTDVASEDGYVMQRRQTGTTTWYDFTTERDKPYFDDSYVEEGESYDYRVKAVNSVGSSGYSTTYTVKAYELLPPSPISIVALSASRVRLSWPAVAGASSYRIERSVDGVDWRYVSDASKTELTYIDIDLIAGTTYQYRLFSNREFNRSTPSAPVFVTTWTKLAEWRQTNFGSTADGGAAAGTAVGADGIPNLLKYASNMGANERGLLAPYPSTKGLPRVTVNPYNNRLSIEFVRRRADSNPGIRYEVQFSNGLGDWAPGGSERQAIPMDDDWDRVIWEDSVSALTVPKRFVRVKVIETP